jgi:hypothetical protein
MTSELSQSGVSTLLPSWKIGLAGSLSLSVFLVVGAAQASPVPNHSPDRAVQPEQVMAEEQARLAQTQVGYQEGMQPPSTAIAATSSVSTIKRVTVTPATATVDASSDIVASSLLKRGRIDSTSNWKSNGAQCKASRDKAARFCATTLYSSAIGSPCSKQRKQTRPEDTDSSYGWHQF